jgi:hypothetical protein
MPKISPEIKKQIAGISKTELEKIVIKMAAKEKAVFDYLLVNYLEKETGENELFEETKMDLDFLFIKSYKGFAQQLQLANMLSACIQRINKFSKICKNKNLETDLVMYVLAPVFELPTGLLGTCFTACDYKVGLMVKRVVTLVQTRLHPDYKIEYAEKINNYLTILHHTSNHINVIFGLPKSI